jgi:carbamate kinase
MRTAVLAIGGNSLVRAGERGTVEQQRQNLQSTCVGISEVAAEQAPPLPLDACVAETQASIGYLLQQSLQEPLRQRGLARPIVTMITQVLVSRRDAAFRNPTKPVGPFYTREQAEERQRSLNWQMVEDAGRGYRRVVPSPQPKVIIELHAIQAALESGSLVIACGLLAWELEADLFLISTGVDQVALNFGGADQKLLDHLSAGQARRYLRQGHFPPGSMGPKIEAALDYLKGGGKQVIITSPERIPEAMQGMAGTRITSTQAPVSELT